MFLTLNKHADPNKSVLAVSARILKILRKKRAESFIVLSEKLERENSGAKLLLPLALNLLFLLGLVEYRPKTDSIEYVGP